MMHKTYELDMVQPMKDELLNAGFREFASLEEIDQKLQGSGTVLVVVNSVCGCSARGARPSVVEALAKAAHKPSQIYTVFAGYDMEETARVRELCVPYPPSSPSMVLFKDGKVAHFLERRHIEGHNKEQIAAHLTEVFNMYCK